VDIKLYTTSPPAGRPLLLIKELSMLSPSLRERSISVVLELFQGMHPHDRPVSIYIENEDFLIGTIALCCEYGIEYEVAGNILS
jgi:hypothetical protein